MRASKQRVVRKFDLLAVVLVLLSGLGFVLTKYFFSRENSFAAIMNGLSVSKLVQFMNGDFFSQYAYKVRKSRIPKLGHTTQFTQFASHLFRDPGRDGHGCDPPGLRASDLHPAVRKAGLVQVLRQLGGFPTSSLPLDNQDLKQRMCS